MPMLTTVSPSTTTQMTTNIHYHTQLQAVWKSDYVYDVTLILIREENTGSTGWNVTNSHGCRIQYIDKNGNLYDSGNVSLAGTNVKIVPGGVQGPAGYKDRSAVIKKWTIETHHTNRRVTAQYYATLDNTSLGGSIESKSFWAPSSNINEAPILPDGPNVYVRSNGAWVRAKDVWVYKDGIWQMAPSGDMNIRTGNTWKS